MFHDLIIECRHLVEANLTGVPSAHLKAAMDVMGNDNNNRLSVLTKALRKKASAEQGAQAAYQKQMTPGKRILRRVLRRPAPQQPVAVNRSVSAYTAQLPRQRMEGFISRVRGLLQVEAYSGGVVKPYKRDLGPEGKRFAKKATSRLMRQQSRAALRTGGEAPRRVTKGKQYPRGFSPPALQSYWKKGGPPPTNF